MLEYETGRVQQVTRELSQRRHRFARGSIDALVVIVAALVLLIAPTLALGEIAVNVFWFRGHVNATATGVLTLVSLIELVAAVLLIYFPRGRPVRLSAGLLYILLASVSGFHLWRGDGDCGCLSSIRIPPLVMMTFDIAIGSLLLGGERLRMVRFRRVDFRANRRGFACSVPATVSLIVVASIVFRFALVHQSPLIAFRGPIVLSATESGSLEATIPVVNTGAGTLVFHGAQSGCSLHVDFGNFDKVRLRPNETGYVRVTVAIPKDAPPTVLSFALYVDHGNLLTIPVHVRVIPPDNMVFFSLLP